jgi:hypothetical protein
MSKAAGQSRIDLEFVDWDPAEEIAEFLDRPGPEYDMEKRLHVLFDPLPETVAVSTMAVDRGEATEPAEASPTQSNRFIIVPHEVAFDASLTVTARHLYTILLSYSFGKEEVWPGQDRLAKLLGLKVRMLQNYLIELESHNVIEREVRGNKMTNKYRLKILPPRIKLAGNPSDTKYSARH